MSEETEGGAAVEYSAETKELGDTGWTSSEFYGIRTFDRIPSMAKLVSELGKWVENGWIFPEPGPSVEDRVVVGTHIDKFVDWAEGAYPGEEIDFEVNDRDVKPKMFEDMPDEDDFEIVMTVGGDKRFTFEQFAVKADLGDRVTDSELRSKMNELMDQAISQLGGDRV